MPARSPVGSSPHSTMCRCPACGAARDTLVHRVLFCEAKAVAEMRQKVAPLWLLRERGSLTEQQAELLIRGLIANPAQ